MDDPERSLEAMRKPFDARIAAAGAAPSGPIPIFATPRRRRVAFVLGALAVVVALVVALASVTKELTPALATPVPATSTPPAPTSDPASSTSDATTSTPEPLLTMIEHPDWLVPTSVPGDLQLVVKDVQPTVDLSRGIPDCAFVPDATHVCGKQIGVKSTLQYALPSDRMERTVDITQDVAPTAPREWTIYNGEQRTLGDRTVRDTSEGDFRRVWWQEDDHLYAAVATWGLSAAEVDDIVLGLQRGDAAAWDALEAQALPPIRPECADPDRLFAPTYVPEGWQTFVLTIEPVGTCNASPVSMISIGRPPRDGEEYGEFVTIVVSYATYRRLGSDTELWGDRTVRVGRETLDPSPSASGARSPVGSVVFVEAGMWIDAHGPVRDEAEMRRIVDGIRVVDAATWQALNDAEQKPPLGAG